MLPYDYARCDPDRPSSDCENCKRYVNQPDQTWGPRTPVTMGLLPMSDSCHYIKIKETNDEERN